MEQLNKSHHSRTLCSRSCVLGFVPAVSQLWYCSSLSSSPLINADAAESPQHSCSRICNATLYVAKHVSAAAGVIAGIVSYIIINGTSLVLDLCYKRMGWTIKGSEDYSLEKPDLSLHKAELDTELAGSKVDDSASGLKRKQSALPLNNPVEDNDAFYAKVRVLSWSVPLLPAISPVCAHRGTVSLTMPPAWSFTMDLNGPVAMQFVPLLLTCTCACGRVGVLLWLIWPPMNASKPERVTLRFKMGGLIL